MKFRRQNGLVIKSILGLFFGMLVNHVFRSINEHSLNFYAKEICNKHCICSSCGPNSITLPLDDEIREAYVPKGMYEITRWLYFDNNNLYDKINSAPKAPLIGQYHEETVAITQVAMEYINVNTIMGRTWKIMERESGYMRTDVLQGTQYIVDLKVQSMQDDLAKTFRVEMLHPFKSEKEWNFVSYYQNVYKDVNIIVVLSGDASNAIEFLSKYKTLAMSLTDICLTVAMFKGRGLYATQHDPQLSMQLNKWKDENKDLCMNIYQINGDFNYLNALKELMKHVDENSIVLTLQDDMDFSKDVIENCEIITQMNKRVYFPIVFSQFNPENIENGMPSGKPKNIDKRDINKFTGDWEHNDHDVLCAYAVDLNNILANIMIENLEENNEKIFTQSGNFGNILYNKFLSLNFDVISAVEPGLLKLYKDLNCSNIDNKVDKRKCTIRRLESLGSKQSLNILYLMKHGTKLR